MADEVHGDADVELPWPDELVELVPESFAQSKWPDLPREKQITRAKQRAAWLKRYNTIDETGRRMVGGPQPGSGRKRTRDLGAVITEMAEGSRQRDITNALFSGLHGPDKKLRVTTAEKIAKIVDKHKQREFEERKYEDEPLAELRKMVAKRLAQMSSNGDLPDPRENSIDSTATEIAEDAA